MGLGDVPEYGSAVGTGGPGKIYRIEKYISINGTRYNSENATQLIRQKPENTRIADHYPGTLRVLENEYKEEVGITGNIGVRYGLVFYYMDGSTKKEITSVEIDSLDLLVQQFRGLEANSKLLLCLLNHLKNDPKYKPNIDWTSN